MITPGPGTLAPAVESAASLRRKTLTPSRGLKRDVPARSVGRLMLATNTARQAHLREGPASRGLAADHGVCTPVGTSGYSSSCDI